MDGVKSLNTTYSTFGDEKIPGEKILIEYLQGHPIVIVLWNYRISYEKCITRKKKAMRNVMSEECEKP